MTPGPVVFWTEDAIVEAIRQWTNEYGRPPSSEQWDTAGRGHPSSVTVRARFGTFQAARQAAGVTFRRKNCAGQWTRDGITDAYVRWVYTHGRLPLQDEWRQPTADTPGLATIRRLFGSWNIMVATVGYPPRYARRSAESYRRVGQQRVGVGREDGWEARRAHYLEILRGAA